MTTTRRTAIYTRISVDRDGRSEAPGRQEADCRALAKLRGWKVQKVYSDRDLTAWKRSVERPQYDRLIRDLRDRQVDALIVWKLDRLTRRGVVGVAQFLEVLEETGAELVSVQEPFIDTTSPIGKGVLGLMASMAEQESENTSIRTARTHLAAAKNGKMHAGGNRRYGYRDGKIDPAEAAVILEVTDRVLAGESLRTIAKDLNARGIKTSVAGKRRKPRGHQVVDPELLGDDGKYEVRGEWRSVTLSQVLRSPTIAGIRVHRGEVTPGSWEPILSEEVFDELQRVLASRRSDQSAADRSHLLSGAGVIRCGECKQPMRRMSFRQGNGKLFHRYQCLDQPGQTQCGHVSIAQKSTDEFVVGELLDFLDYAEIRPLDGEDDEDEVTAELDDLKTNMTELVQDRFVRHKLTRDDYDAARDLLADDISRVEARLLGLRRRREERRLTVPIGDREALGVWWDAATDTEKIQAVRQAIVEVKVRPAMRRGGNRFDPTRLMIEWNWDAFRLTAAGRRLERFHRTQAIESSAVRKAPHDPRSCRALPGSRHGR